MCISFCYLPFRNKYFRHHCLLCWFHILCSFYPMYLWQKQKNWGGNETTRHEAPTKSALCTKKGIMKNTDIGYSELWYSTWLFDQGLGTFLRMTSKPNGPSDRCAIVTSQQSDVNNSTLRVTSPEFAERSIVTHTLQYNSEEKEGKRYVVWQTPLNDK